ncbi:MAG: phage terminase large subunit [Myxococcota bacterium]
MVWTPADRQHYVELCLDDDVANTLDLERALFQDAWGSLGGFVQQCWPILEPGVTLEWAWYHDLVCRELEGVTEAYHRRERRRLVICIPPGCMKSLLVSVFWPAWWWLKAPHLRFLTLSGTEKVAVRDSRRMRDVVGSHWYKRLVVEAERRGKGKAWELSRDQSSVLNFANGEKGLRQCFSTGSKLVGLRGDGIIIDDPHDVADVIGTPEQVQNNLERAHDTVDVRLPSRVNDQRIAFDVAIQQRLAIDDVAGRRLKDPDPALRKIVLAAHFDPDAPYNHPDDPRTERGELLDPERLPESELQRLMTKLESQAHGQGQAQYEQNPVPPAGGLFQRAWTNRRYDWDPQRPPFRFDEVAVTIDCTFKATKKADFVSMQAWGRRGWTEYYLLDEVHERLSYTELRQATRDYLTKWRPDATLIEEKANGAALIDDLKHEFPGIVPFIPDRHGDKVSRASVTTVYWAAGNVWLPNPEWAPWVGDYVAEVCSFPFGTHDDRVDAKVQLFIWWKERAQTGGTDAVNSALERLLGL